LIIKGEFQEESRGEEEGEEFCQHKSLLFCILQAAVVCGVFLYFFTKQNTGRSSPPAAGRPLLLLHPKIWRTFYHHTASSLRQLQGLCACVAMIGLKCSMVQPTNNDFFRESCFQMVQLQRKIQRKIG
jgi:hypothetical protein